MLQVHIEMFGFRLGLDERGKWYRQAIQRRAG
jgi:hypothetical protein